MGRRLDRVAERCGIDPVDITRYGRRTAAVLLIGAAGAGAAAGALGTHAVDEHHSPDTVTVQLVPHHQQSCVRQPGTERVEIQKWNDEGTTTGDVWAALQHVGWNDQQIPHLYGWMMHHNPQIQNINLVYPHEVLTVPVAHPAQVCHTSTFLVPTPEGHGFLANPHVDVHVGPQQGIREVLQGIGWSKDAISRQMVSWVQDHNEVHGSLKAGDVLNLPSPSAHADHDGGLEGFFLSD